MKNKSDLILSGQVSSALISLVLPMIFGMLSLFIINLVDAYYIGKLGVIELSAISFSFPVLFTVMSFNIGIAIGVSATISRFIGSGKNDKAKLVIGSILFLIFNFTLVISLVGFLVSDPLFKVLGADELNLPLIKQYMNIWYIGAPFFGVIVIANASLRSTGDGLTPSIIIFSMALMNAILDPIFIFGFGPIKAFGIQGAAIATSLSYILGTIAMLVILISRKLITWPERKFSLLIDSCKPILFIGLPASFTMMLNPVVLGYINKIVSLHGNAAVAAFGVGLRIESIATIGIIAISSSLTPFIGLNLGAKKIDRIKKAINYSIVFSSIWGISVALPLFFFNNYFATIFSNEIAVQEYIMTYLKIISFSYIFWGWSNIASAAFNGFQKPLYSTLIYLGRLFIITVPFVIIGNYYYGLIGIFFGIFLANVFSGIISIPWTRLLFKSKNKDLEYKLN